MVFPNRRKNTGGNRCVRDFGYDSSKDINKSNDHVTTDAVTIDSIQRDGKMVVPNVINSKLTKDKLGSIRCWHGRDKSQSRYLI